MLDFNFLILLLIIVTAVIRMPPFPCAEACISWNDDRAYNSISTIDANLATLIREADMLNCGCAKTRRFEKLGKLA